MLTRRTLFTSLCTAIVGIAFAVPALSNPPGSAANPGSQATVSRSYLYSQGQYGQYPQGIALIPHRRFAGYPCTWSGSRDLAHGETAYRRGRYAGAITQWKTAASKDCAIAAYKLGMLYYGGKSQVSPDRSLGAAWLRVAAESKTATRPYYHEMSQMAVGALTKDQRADYAADYARLRSSLGLPTAG